MIEKLKACPFCGNTNSLNIDVDDDVFAVNCNWKEGGCGATGGYRYTEEEAIEVWNNRPVDKKPPLTIEELKEISADMENCSWVWIEILPDYKIYKPYSETESAYYRVQKDYTKGESLCCGYPGFGFYFKYEDYGETWLAYRIKPEEEVIHE